MRTYLAPLNICFGITSKCNLRCKHCWIATSQSGPDLPTKAVLNIIRQMEELPVFDVKLFGGEPFVRKDLFTILEGFRKTHIKLSIDTNGTLITKEIAKRLSNYRIFSYTVSLDGSCAAVHESLRGPGSFARTIAGIKHLVAREYKVLISTTVTRLNLSDIANIAALCKTLGVSNIWLHNLLYMGKGYVNRKDLFIAPEERLALLALLERLRKTYGNFVGGSAFHGLEILTQRRKSHAAFPFQVRPCVAANKKCAIRPDGWVTPCELLWEVKAGNLKKQTLRDIWRASSVMASFRKPLELKEEEIPDCKRCRHFEFCYGRSRCQPYYNDGGRLKHREFYCWQQP